MICGVEDLSNLYGVLIKEIYGPQQPALQKAFCSLSTLLSNLHISTPCKDFHHHVIILYGLASCHVYIVESSNFCSWVHIVIIT
jgi:hypothetical protein